MCSSGQCGLTCDTGSHLCGSSCLSDTSAESCGASCSASVGRLLDADVQRSVLRLHVRGRLRELRRRPVGRLRDFALDEQRLRSLRAGVHGEQHVVRRGELRVQPWLCGLHGPVLVPGKHDFDSADWHAGGRADGHDRRHDVRRKLRDLSLYRDGLLHRVRDLQHGEPGGGRLAERPIEPGRLRLNLDFAPSGSERRDAMTGNRPRRA